MAGLSIGKKFGPPDERGFLVLGIKPDETVLIETSDGKINVGIHNTANGWKIGIKAPRSMKISRTGRGGVV